MQSTACYTVLDSPSAIRSLQSDRLPAGQTFSPPPEWADARFRYALDFVFTLDREVELGGRSTFGGHPMAVRLLPLCNMADRLTRFGLVDSSTPAKLEFVSQGSHNIAVGPIQIVEHPLALRQGAGILVDYRLTSSNFPSFPTCASTFLEAVRPQMSARNAIRAVTVRKPVALTFSNGAYAIFEPDEGSRTLEIDLQIAHPKNCLGTQRVRYVVEPASFAYLASARPMSYGWKSTVLNRVARFCPKQRIPWTGIYLDNFVVVARDRILNGSSKFEFKGRNYEPILHEIIDKLGALGFIAERLVGKLTIFRTSHAQDIELVRHIVDLLT